ncbi:hypothetical protein BJP40_05275 [Streptomyces sp. CC53]|uniref:hypothetical protein n=1 Tax=unclassified Streptomyces TaxID=2593676 RepID=UPI0008DE1EAC|nr:MULTISPECIES: hypothetical protein [unclassified Streptomyces]OII61465.1 hypothetical protein BJP40_05275 [Streptomyces sp. CC53]
MDWWTVLYVAFGVVALWLLGEVLLQYKARLRWRLVAFFGFLGVVAGVFLSSIPLIIAGAVAFGVGQTCVTLSFLRGFSTGWALGGRPGASRRRRTAPKDAGPTLEVSGLEYADDDRDRSDRDPGASQDTGHDTAAQEALPPTGDTGAYGPYGAETTDPSTATSEYGAYPDYGTGDYTGAYGYGYGGEQQGYAAYSDPYIGTTTTAAGQPYGTPAYDDHGSGQQFADPYAGHYGTDTPPGGVWVPPQRDAPQPYPPQPQDQPGPYDYDQTGQTYRY